MRLAYGQQGGAVLGEALLTADVGRVRAVEALEFDETLLGLHGRWQRAR